MHRVIDNGGYEWHLLPEPPMPQEVVDYLLDNYSLERTIEIAPGITATLVTPPRKQKSPTGKS